MNLKSLQEKYNGCYKCKNCMNTCKVFGCGNPSADIMVVGEGPGRDDVELNTPFSDKSGMLLRKILNVAKLDENDLYFTNVILCRTNEKDRAPSWEETLNCHERLNEEINLVRPNVIIMVGSHSLKRFFGQKATVRENHGTWLLDFQPPYARYFSIYNTSWILNSCSEGEEKARKRTMWDDMKTFISEIDVVNFAIKESQND